MSLQMKLISDHTEIIGDDSERLFGEKGGTIGRSLQNDWILPDPDRFISGRHAVIDFRSGIYYIADLSTNGVYINDDREPIGKGNPRRLFSGDIVRMGDFEFGITIDEGEDLEMPEDPEPSVVPDNIEQLVPEEEAKTGVELLKEEEITGDDEFQSALFNSLIVGADADSENSPDDNSRFVRPKPKLAKDKPAKADMPDAVDDVQAAIDEDISEDVHEDDSINASAELSEYVSEYVPQISAEDMSATDLLDSFLDGLGINRAELHESIDLAEIMQNAGQVMREFVSGTSKLLMSRANLKNAFHLDQTTVLPRHNNPLKLATNTNDSIKQLLVGRDGEYLGPRDAVREICNDLVCHQEAFLDAMNSAFIEFSDRFDPEELSESFNRTIDRSWSPGFLKKRKYWDLYCKLYPVMTEKGGGKFPTMYADEFVKAYERQIAEYKRLERSGPSVDQTDIDLTSTRAELVQTVIMDEPETDDEQEDDWDSEPEHIDPFRLTSSQRLALPKR